jgi:TolA-binding protein
LGESYYNLKDYGRAIHTFDSLVAEYPGNEKVPAALYKLGLATAETGDLARSRKNLKRVLEEFPSSDESKLAKNKLAEIR